MGLDWQVMCEEYGKTPFDLIGGEKYRPSWERHRERGKGIIEMYKQALRNNELAPFHAMYWSKDENELLTNFHDMVFVETISPDLYSFCPPWDPKHTVLTAFDWSDGRRIQYSELIPSSIQLQAYESKDTEEMMEYADLLESCLPSKMPFNYEKAKARIDVARENQMYPKYHKMYSDVKTIKDASQWLRFWAKYPVRLKASL